VWWNLSKGFYCKSAAESEGRRILKIGYHLAKLPAKHSSTFSTNSGHFCATLISYQRSESSIRHAYPVLMDSCYITFHVSRRSHEMYCGQARLCVCLSADPDVTWRSGRDPPSCALLGGFAIGARVALLWQHDGNVWQSPVVICQAHHTPHAVQRTTHAGEDWLPSPAIRSTPLLSVPFHFVHTAGVL